MPSTKTVTIKDYAGTEHKIKLTAQIYAEDGACCRALIPAGFALQSGRYVPKTSLVIVRDAHEKLSDTGGFCGLGEYRRSIPEALRLGVALLQSGGLNLML